MIIEVYSYVQVHINGGDLHRNISKAAPAIHRSLSSTLQGQPSPHLLVTIVQHILYNNSTNPSLTYFNHFKFPNKCSIDKFFINYILKVNQS